MTTPPHYTCNTVTFHYHVQLQTSCRTTESQTNQKWCQTWQHQSLFILLNNPFNACSWKGNISFIAPDITKLNDYGKMSYRYSNNANAHLCQHSYQCWCRWQSAKVEVDRVDAVEHGHVDAGIAGRRDALPPQRHPASFQYVSSLRQPHHLTCTHHYYCSTVPVPVKLHLSHSL